MEDIHTWQQTGGIGSRGCDEGDGEGLDSPQQQQQQQPEIVVLSMHQQASTMYITNVIQEDIMV